MVQDASSRSALRGRLCFRLQGMSTLLALALRFPVQGLAVFRPLLRARSQLFPAQGLAGYRPLWYVR